MTAVPPPGSADNADNARVAGDTSLPAGSDALPTPDAPTPQAPAPSAPAPPTDLTQPPTAAPEVLSQPPGPLPSGFPDAPGGTVPAGAPLAASEFTTPVVSAPFPATDPSAPVHSEPPRPRWRRQTVVLAIVAALLFVLSATMTGFYLDARAELHSANSDIRGLKTDLRDARKALRRNQANLDDAEVANRALSRCAREVTKVFDTLDRTGEANISRARSACNRARPYMNSDD